VIEEILLTGGYGYVAGTFFGILIMGLLKASEAFPDIKVEVAQKHRAIVTAIASGNASRAHALTTEVIRDRYDRAFGSRRVGT